MPMSGSRSPDSPELSLLTQFDDLVRNSNALNRGEEKEFLTFVRSSGLLVSSLGNSNANSNEVNQRMESELQSLVKENTGLKLKLEQARSLVDNESKARRKAEQERDRLAHQFQLLRQLILETDGVDEGTLRRVKFLEEPVVPLPSSSSSPSQGYPTIISPGLMSLREGLSKPSGKRRSVNMTEESVFDVDDLNLSFDETANLCESRVRLEQSYLGQQGRGRSERKRSRSVTRREEQQEPEDRLKKRERRSRSVGINDRVEILEITPRITQEEKQDDPPFFSSRRQEHSFEEKTNIKSANCSVCNKRIKFGKKLLSCVRCKMIIHPECSDSVQEDCRGQVVTSSPTTVSTNPSIFLSRTPSKKEQKKIFASPMLQ